MAHKSKLSFQYGFSVLLLTLVVLVCSPLMVATAKGSGKPVAGQYCNGVEMEADGGVRGSYGKHHAYRGHRRQ